jgi:hypothetical protein
MIDMIRVGRTRNLLRASSSPSEIWPRSAHLHLGQRHLTGRTKRPDKSPHSITTPKAQKFLANEGGIHKSPHSITTPKAQKFLANEGGIHKSPHSITTPKAQKFLANEGGIHKRRLTPGPSPLPWNFRKCVARGFLQHPDHADTSGAISARAGCAGGCLARGAGGIEGGTPGAERADEVTGSGTCGIGAARCDRGRAAAARGG